MTREEFIQWLESEIQEMGSIFNDIERLSQIRDGAMARAHALEQAKEKFLSIVTPETTI